MPTLRKYQESVRELRRSLRRFIPLIAYRTGLTGGVVTCYMDGYGSDVVKYKVIIDALRQIELEYEEKAKIRELDAKRDKIITLKKPVRRYIKQF